MRELLFARNKGAPVAWELLRVVPVYPDECEEDELEAGATTYCPEIVLEH